MPFNAVAILGRSTVTSTRNKILYPEWFFSPSQVSALCDTNHGRRGPGLAASRWAPEVWLPSRGPGTSFADCRTCSSLLGEEVRT